MWMCKCTLYFISLTLLLAVALIDDAESWVIISTSLPYTDLLPSLSIPVIWLQSKKKLAGMSSPIELVIFRIKQIRDHYFYFHTAYFWVHVMAQMWKSKIWERWDLCTVQGRDFQRKRCYHTSTYVKGSTNPNQRLDDFQLMHKFFWYFFQLL